MSIFRGFSDDSGIGPIECLALNLGLELRDLGKSDLPAKYRKKIALNSISYKRDEIAIRLEFHHLFIIAFFATPNFIFCDLFKHRRNWRIVFCTLR